MLSLSDLSVWWEKRKKILYFILVVLAVAGAGVYYYFVSYKEPREKEAYEVLAFCEQSLRMDSLTWALNGRGKDLGLLRLMERYEGTQAANLAAYYAGAIWLRQGDAQRAVDYLQKYHTTHVLGESRKVFLLADAYADLKNTSQAVSYYLKGADIGKDDELFAAECLFRAALLQENVDKAQAIQLYQRIKKEYPKTKKSQEVDKYLARLGVY